MLDAQASSSPHPIMVAVAGDSGSGKAALCSGLCGLFGDGRCSVVHLDGYFALNRVQRNAVGLSPLDPRVHDFARMDDDLYRLRSGEAIEIPVYDHHKGDLTGTEPIDVGDVVLVEGRFPLFTHVLRALFDVAVWLEREPGCRLPWTVHVPIAADASEGARIAAERRRYDYTRWLAPQARCADVRIRFGPDSVTIGGQGPDETISAADAPLVVEQRRAALLTRDGRLDLSGIGRWTRDGNDLSFPLLALAQLAVVERIGDVGSGARVASGATG